MCTKGSSDSLKKSKKERTKRDHVGKVIWRGCGPNRPHCQS